MDMSKCVRIGRWSVLGPRLAGSVSQEISVLQVCSVQNTLSGLVQFLELKD